MRFRLVPWLLLPLVLLAPVCEAQEPENGAGSDAGACASAQSTAETKDCLAEQLQRADKELNAVWPQVLKSIDATPAMASKDRRKWREAIVGAQKAWVAYKQLECRGSAPNKFFGGTQAGVEALDCELQKTLSRLDELKAYLEN
jgi:uncharacterized protein YecT (DUF1311 family)